MTDSGAGSRFWTAATRAAVIAVVILSGLHAALSDTGIGDVVEFLVGALIGAAAIAAALAVVRLCAIAFRPLPPAALAAFGAVLIALIFLAANTPATIVRTVLDPGKWGWPAVLSDGLAFPALFVIVLSIAALAGWVELVRSRRVDQLEPLGKRALAAGTAVLVAASGLIAAGLAGDGSDPFPSEFRTLTGAAVEPIPDPSMPGRYQVDSFTYGAGENMRRPEFGIDRDFESRTVDASALLPDWKGVKKRMREWYWGFGLEHAPLNGLLWAPRGSGPFPLVLIVHGNHGMEDYSDPGYAYLGELLASRGFIAVSVDQNFINGSWSGDFRGKEMPLRAWLLLQHLRLWRDWQQTAGHPFGGRVDLERLALVGHSRGGEAVSIAYAYNALPHYPDDATVAFDFGFGIRALVAIAQVDQRYHRRVELDDVNFLALQGSYDSDEPAYHGLRQLNRITLGDDGYRFKAGIYIHRANHGQFNSIWGRQDARPPESWLLNLAPIIPPEEQRQIAKVYVAAFLEATLKGERDYVRLFRDPRAAARWLPDHAYINQFMDSSFVPIATFEEDLDVTTATADAATISASGFSLWREEELKHRDERLQGTDVVVLGWDDGDAPVYTIEVPAISWDDAIDGDAVLTLSVSGSTEVPRVDGVEDDHESDMEPLPPRFSLEAELASGQTSSIDAEELANLAPPLKVQYLKSKRLNKERYNAEWEPVLQVVEAPLARLLPAGTHTADIRYLRLRFDGSQSGVVILDDIGIRQQ